MINNIPDTGWFIASNPEADYEVLRKIASRSVFGDSGKIDKLDLVGIEEDFRNGKYEYRDYFLGFVDGGNRGEQINNALHDMNIYLSALTDYRRRYGNFQNLSAVRFHQTNFWVDRVVFAEKGPDAPPNIAV